MKTVIIAFLSILIFTACDKNSISGSGATVTETRALSPFTSVQLEGSARINVVQGATQRVEVTGYENLVPIFETYLQNGTLVLKFKNDYYNISNNNITVNIILPNLVAVGINGSGEYSIKDFHASNLRAEINGSGDIYAESCSYTNALLRVNGSGSIRAAELTANEAETEISGSGKIDITSTQKIKAIIRGSGEINYYGNPAVVSVDVSGSGKVNKK